MSRPPRWMVATFALGLLALGLAGASFYVAQRRYLVRTASANLLAVAQAKLDQIAAWRTERLADAAVLQESPFFVRAVARWLAGRQPELAADILTRLRSNKNHYGYDDVQLVDRAGRVLLATSGRNGGLDPAEAGALSAALRDRRPTMGEVLDSADDSIPHLAVVAPLFASSARAAEPLGAVVHMVDPRRSLFRLVESWPSSGPSTEAVLVQRDGDSVLFLSERRFQPGPALPRRVSLSRRDVPAVLAVLGTEGVMRGADYRGIKVLAALRAVPGTPWFLVIKVDEAEALAVWRTEAALVFAALLGLVLTAGATAVAVSQRIAKAHFRRLYEAEAALSASEERYRLLFDGITDAVFVHGLNDDGLPAEFLAVNDVACERLGYTREELLRMAVRDIDAPESPVDVRAIVKRLKQGETVLFEQTHVTKDGRRIPMEVHVQSFPLHGRPVALSVVRDITERKRAEQSLKESEAKYRNLIEQAWDAIFVADQDGEILLVNAQACLMLGYTQAELVQLNIADTYAAEERAAVAKRIAKAQLGEHLRYERSMVRKDGTTCPVEVAIGMLPNGSIQGIVRDITERRRAEETLRASDQHLREAQRVAKVGSWEFDLTTGLVTWSEECYRMQGRDPERPAPRYEELHRYYTPESWERLSIAMQRAMATGAPYQLDLEVIREDGTRSWQSARGEAIRSTAGKIDRLHGTVLDITERKRAETTLRALALHLEAVREEEHTLIAREIHDELGQALTALRLDLVWLGRKLPEGSTALRGRLDGAVQLTNEMITVGQRIVGNLRPPVLDDLGLVPAVEWYTQQFAKRSGLRIELDVGAKGPVVTDRLAVTAYRIVQEALTNVARHAQATQVMVRLGEQDGALTLEIRDDGQGFREEAAHDPHSFGIVGMRERAASHGGALVITSSPGAGTTVRATFPFDPTPH